MSASALSSSVAYKKTTCTCDLLMSSETKIDNSFPKGQFLIKDFRDPFRIDKNFRGGGILFYLREDIFVKFLFVGPFPVENFFVEKNLWKIKWFVCFSLSFN